MSRKITPTYILLNQITLTANTSSVIIDMIPNTYADLVLLVNGPASNGFDFIRFNSNTSNYSRVGMGGNGSTTISFAAGNSTAVDVGMGVSHRFSYTINVMDYSATDKHKTVLLRGNVPEGTANQPILAGAYRWGDTSAITSITFSTGGAYVSGTSFSLYGVIA
jgi:hypothetical protein